MSASSGSVTIRFLLAAVGVLLLYVAGIVVRGHYGIGVLVRNESGQIVGEASVAVDPGGEKHDLQTIAPGQHRRVFVRPLTESSIVLRFVDADGQSRTETLAGYIEGGYCGNIRATILSGTKVEAKKDIDPLFCRKSWFDFIAIANLEGVTRP